MYFVTNSSIALDTPSTIDVYFVNNTNTLVYNIVGYINVNKELSDCSFEYFYNGTKDIPTPGDSEFTSEDGANYFSITFGFNNSAYSTSGFNGKVCTITYTLATANAGSGTLDFSFDTEEGFELNGGAIVDPDVDASHVVNISIGGASTYISLSSIKVDNNNVLGSDPNYTYTTASYSATTASLYLAAGSDCVVSSIKYGSTTIYPGTNTATQAINLGNPGNATTVTFVVMSSDSSASKTYTIAITRAQSTDTGVEITITGSSDNIVYTKDSSSTSTVYIYNIPTSAGQAVITATPSGYGASVTGTGSYTIPTAGISITTTAQSGATRTITVNIVKAKDTDNTISNIKVLAAQNGLDIVDVDNKSYTFGDSSTYTLTVRNGVSSIWIDATATSSTAYFKTGVTGTQVLSVGTNTFTVYATSEAGVDGTGANVYTITIIRNAKANVDLSITGITVIGSGTNYLTDFAQGTTTYNVSVPYTVSSVTVNATTPSGSGTTVVGAQGYDLTAGVLKTVTVYSSYTDDDGTQTGTTYTLRITRAAAETNAYLSSISVNGTPITGFVKTTYGYTLPTVDRSVTSIEVSAVVEGDYATITSGTGPQNLNVGTNTITIVVTAQSSSTKSYTLTIKRQELANTITGITVTGNNVTVTPSTWDAATTTYSIAIPYSTTQIEFAATYDGTYGSISGTGILTITGSSATRTIYAVSEAGESGTSYTYNITRASASDDRSLSDLTVALYNGTTVLQAAATITGFESTKTSYSLVVDRAATSIVIGATQNDPLATIVSGPDTYSLTAGVRSTITIKVRSERGNETNYQISVIPAEEKNVISNIIIKDSNGNPLSTTVYDFKPLATTPSFTVPYTTSSLIFEVEYGSTFSDNSGAYGTVTGSGSVAISSTTTHEVYVTSEAGVKGTVFTFTITKDAPKTINTLTDISMELYDSGNNVIQSKATIAGFASGTITYNLVVDRAAVKAKVYATIVEDSSSSVSGAGTLTSGLETNGYEYILTPGTSSQIIILVSAESGSTRSYSLNVLPAEQKNVISDITITGNGAEMTPAAFDPDVTSYSIQIPYTTSTVGFSVAYGANKTDNSGVYGTVTGTSASVTAGSSITHSVYVTSEAGVKGTTYTFTIERLRASSDAKLSNIEIKYNDGAYSAIENFNSNTKTYSIYVDRTHAGENVTIKPTKSNAGASIKIDTVSVDNATKALTLSTWTSFSIEVTAESGSKETYQVSLMPAETDNTVTGVTITGTMKTAPQEWAAGTTSYTIVVPYTTSALTFAVDTAAQHGVITGAGECSLSVGSNSLDIYITSEAGVKGTTYTYSITREAASTDVKLATLTATYSGGSIELGFTPSTTKTTFSKKLERTFDDVEVTVAATANNEFATVTIDSAVQTLAAPTKTTYTITVQAQSGATQQYVVELTPIEQDNAITDIAIAESVTSISPSVFSAATKAYTVNVPYTISKLTFTVSTDAQYGTITGDGETATLNVGSNTHSIYLTSEDGVKGETYTYTIVRAADRIDLSALTIEAGTGDDPYTYSALVLNFVSTTVLYNIYIDTTTVKAVNIQATAEDPLATVALPGSDGVVVLSSDQLATLNAGNPVALTVVVTGQGSTTKTYTINLRSKAFSESDATISSITILGSDGREYTLDSNDEVSVPFSVSSVVIYATAASSAATVTGTGNKNLSQGLNNITVSSISGDGSNTDTRTIKITRESASADSSLSALTLDGVAILADLVANSNTYTYSYPRTTSSVTIEATANHLGAQVSGDTGVLSATIGVNTYKVTVTAESGAKTVYTIKVVTAETDNTINRIDITGTISDTTPYTWNASTLTYNLTVPYSTSQLTFTVNTDAEHGTVVGAGIKAVNSGNNTYKIYILSEAGEKGTEYTYNVTRIAADTNSTLSALSVDGENLDLTSGTSFTVYKDRSTTSVNIAATATASTATITNLGENAVARGTNSITVKVTAESGASTSYTITVVVAETNNTITNIEIQGANYTFNNSDRNVPLTVPYSTAVLTFTVTTDANYGTVYGAGGFNLSVGSGNVAHVYVVSEAGVKGDEYVFTIEREAASSDATLSDLTIDGTTVTGFNASTTEYSIDRVSSGSIVIGATPTKAGSLVSGTGTESVIIGKNVFAVRVTAESGDSTIYTLTVNCGDNDYGIVDIQISGVTREELGWISNYDYYGVSIPYSQTSVTITVITSSNKATVTGAGDYSIDEILPRHVEIYATSESGKKSDIVYKFDISREVANADSSLKSLTINGVAVDGFSSSVHTYNYSVNAPGTITIGAEATKSTSVITGLGAQPVVIGSNTLTVESTAEDGSKTTYTIVVLCGDSNNGISDITIDGITDESIFKFVNTTTSYGPIQIPYTQAAVKINATAESADATVSGAGEYTIPASGQLVVTVYATSQTGVQGQAYTITFQKITASSEKGLSALTINGVTVDGFNKNTLTYTYNLTRSELDDVDNKYVEVGAVLESGITATISGTGSRKVEIGKTPLTVRVTAEDGSSQDYIVTVVYGETLNGIKNITLSNIDYTFNNSVTVIEITVPYTTATTLVTVEAEGEHASITGSGEYTLNAGYTKNIKVYATSEVGVKGQEYTFKITREAAATSTTLSDIKINDVSLPDFASNKTSYTKNVVYETTRAYINAVPTDTLSSMTITAGGVDITDIGYIDLADGDNVVTITVMAQSGNSQVYLVNIVRLPADGALTLLAVEGYVLKDKDGNSVTFDPKVTEYYINVPYEVVSASSLNFIHEEESDVTVNVYNDKKNLTVAKAVEVTFMAIPAVETANTTFYTIYVTRDLLETSRIDVENVSMVDLGKPNVDNKEVPFEVIEVVNETSYDVSSNTYKLVVDSDVSNIDFLFDFNTGDEEKAPSVTLLGGGEDLEFGHNTVIAVVTSSDRTNTRVLYYDIVRKDVVLSNAKINQIEKFASDFNNGISSYSYKVDSDVNTLDISFDTDSTATTYRVTGADRLEEGVNLVTISVYSGEQLVKTYTLSVYKDSTEQVFELPFYLLIIIICVIAFVLILVILIVAWIVSSRKNKRI